MKKQDFWNGTVGIFYIGCFAALLIFIAYLLYGPGITITVPDFFGANGTTTESATLQAPLSGRSGRLFECEGGRALKAEFAEGTVNLALSDGRQIILPQTVAASGEVRYANPDGSFAFKNIENAILVEENGSVTYANCTAAM